jgi:hypothetical protein
MQCSAKQICGVDWLHPRTKGVYLFVVQLIENGAPTTYIILLIKASLYTCRYFEVWSTMHTCEISWHLNSMVMYA